MKEALKSTTIADRLLLVFMIGLSISFFPLIRKVIPAGSEVVIEIEGKPAYMFPVNERRTLIAESSYGRVRVEIGNGRVRVTEASCSNKLCVLEGWVEQGVIICLPSRIAVFVRSSGKPVKKDIDAKTG